MGGSIYLGHSPLSHLGYDLGTSKLSLAHPKEFHIATLSHEYKTKATLLCGTNRNFLAVVFNLENPALLGRCFSTVLKISFFAISEKTQRYLSLILRLEFSGLMTKLIAGDILND